MRVRSSTGVPNIGLLKKKRFLGSNYLLSLKKNDAGSQFPVAHNTPVSPTKNKIREHLSYFVLKTSLVQQNTAMFLPLFLYARNK